MKPFPVLPPPAAGPARWPALGIAVVVLAACRPPAADHGTNAAGAGEAMALERAPSVQVLAPVAAVDAPAFDCARIVGEDERLICADPQLAALDRRLDAAYRLALEAAGEDRDMLKATQIGWFKGRGDCWKADDQKRCISESYLTRLVELHIDRDDVVAPRPVEYDCDGSGRPFTATFYDGIDPRAVVLTWGNEQVIAFVQPAVGGIRYGRTGLEFRESRGETRVDFHGRKLACRTVE